MYKSNTVDGDVSSIGKCMEYEAVKGKIVYRLINRKRNSEMLKDVPHREILDLVLVYRIIVAIDTDRKGTILINNEIVAKWGITEEKLYELAQENTMRLFKADMMKMQNLLNELMPGNESEVDEDAPQLWILTDNERHYGDTVMVYPEMMEQISEKLGYDFYIIPSSVHELILVKKDAVISTEALKEMICEVNENEVDATEILSDHPYYYDREKGKLEAA